ncbi:MAG: dihydroorotase [Proteobacteria bacterium]|nr:dihydroorotase [Pseudomonadota bacterium]MCP4920168.1 dihydroorotase [Pseudomonadota bacterium]
MTLLLEGGRVLCPASNTDRHADVLIEDGRIVAVGAGFTADETIDCTGRIVSPALVDLDAELSDPGVTWRETLATGSAAAARGGFTTVLASPATKPIADDATLIRELLSRSRREACVEVLASAALTRGLGGEELAELGLMVEAGAVAISNGVQLVTNTLVLRNALLYARPFGCPVLLRAGDADLESLGVMHEGPVSNLTGLRGLPAAAEEMGIARLVALARFSGAHIHVTGVTTTVALEQLRRAHADGVCITASTPALNTYLCDEEILASGYNTSTRLLPPLRSDSDRLAVCDALRSGLLSAATSAHRPRTRVDKEYEFARAEPGASTLETTWSTLVSSLSDTRAALVALSAGPARLLGLDRRVAPGAPAELMVVDPNATWTVDTANMSSQSANSPLHGRELPCPVMKTIHCGRVVWSA